MAAPAIITSILTGGVNNHETTSEEANGVYTDFVSEGVVGSVSNTSGVAPATGSFAVNASGTPDTNVVISTGVAYVNGTPSSQNNQTFRVKCNTSGTAAISANSSGSTKYDWVYIKLDATKLNGPNTAGDDVATIVTSRSSSASSDDGTPPTYGYPLAVVTVANGFSTITNSNIRDVRNQVALNTGTSNAVDGWTAVGTTLTTSSGYNSGGGEYSITTASSQTAVLSPGMKVKVVRGVTPPTQCADLEAGSSQYASKSSPSGISFTDDFTCEAWVKLESYAAGCIVSRFDGSNGWQLSVTGDGRVVIYGDGAATREFTTSRALPLGVWVHVAATLDMSGAAATTYINGASVANSSTGGAGTSLTQAGNLQVGAANGATFFDGEISDVRVWSVVRTATQIGDNMNQQLVGSETNLVAYFKLDGNLNDSTSNANNLTGSGGAVATASDNPMHATEYGEVISVSASTVVVRCPEGYNIPNITLSTPYYSTAFNPFGYPNNTRIAGETILGTNFTTTTSASDVDVTGLSVTFTIPTGGRRIHLEVFCPAFFKSGSTGDTLLLKLKEGSTQLTESLWNVPGSNYSLGGVLCVYEGFAAAGSHTYKVAVNQGAAGTITFTSVPASTKQAILVANYL